MFCTTRFARNCGLTPLTAIMSFAFTVKCHSMNYDSAGITSNFLKNPPD